MLRRSFLCLTALCAPVAMLVTACPSGGGGAGSDGGASDTGASVDAPSGGDSGGGGDGGGRDDGGDGGGGGGVAYSYVDLFQSIYDLGGAVIVTSFGAARFASSGPPTQCTTQVFGACNLVTCLGAATDAGTGGAGLNAGTITISTPVIATNPLVMVFTSFPPNTNGKYGTPDGGNSAVPGQVFSGGDPVSFNVSGGGGIVGFQGTVAAPSAINVNDPTFPDGGTNVVVPIATDLVVTWDAVGIGPTDAGIVPTGFVGVSISPQSATVPHAYCNFPVAAGSGTVPRAVLQGMPVGAAAFTANTSNVATVQVPGFGPVQLNVFQLHPDGNGGTVLLQ